MVKVEIIYTIKLFIINEFRGVKGYKGIYRFHENFIIVFKLGQDYQLYDNNILNYRKSQLAFLLV